VGAGVARIVSKEAVKLLIGKDKLEEMAASLDVLIASRIAPAIYNERFRADDAALEKFLTAWDRLPRSLQQDIGSRLADLAISCEAKERVVDTFLSLDLRKELQPLGPLPTLGRGEASEQPGHKEAVLWLLEEWRAVGRDITIGKIKNDFDDIVPSDTVCFLAWHLAILFPRANKLRSAEDRELWYLKRAHQTLKHLRETGQIEKGKPRSMPIPTDSVD
jgi:hypothetical protein